MTCVEEVVVVAFRGSEAERQPRSLCVTQTRGHEGLSKEWGRRLITTLLILTFAWPPRLPNRHVFLTPSCPSEAVWLGQQHTVGFTGLVLWSGLGHLLVSTQGL